jgi:hypothetical protein
MIHPLAKHVPEEAVPLLLPFLVEHKVKLTIKSERKTRYGDYRHPFQGKGHRISVNAGLNKYKFLVTLIHEMAHLYAWELHKNTIQAHGPEWKQCFKHLLKPFIEQHIFPENVEHAILRSIHNMKASSCSDLSLMRALSEFDETNSDAQTIESIPEGSLFRYQSLVYRKLKKRRTRFECVELQTNRLFMFHPLANITPILE